MQRGMKMFLILLRVFEGGANVRMCGYADVRMRIRCVAQSLVRCRFLAALEMKAGGGMIAERLRSQKTKTAGSFYCPPQPTVILFFSSGSGVMAMQTIQAQEGLL